MASGHTFLSQSWCNVSKSHGHHRDGYGVQLRRLLCGSMACVIAQQRVHPVVVHGNPLTEHKQIFVRARERVDQQVPSFTGWKGCLQPRRSKGKPLALRADHLRDALTCVSCWRRSATTGKVQLLTSTLASFFFCVLLSACLFKTTRTVSVFSVLWVVGAV